MLAETFQPLVKQVYWIPVTINNTSPNKDPAVLDQVSTCGGIYFSGGDQTNLLYCFYDNLATPSPLLQQLYTMNKNGLVVAGSSAGEVIMNGPNMLTDGTSYNALARGTFATSSPKQPGPEPDDVTYWPRGGFEFFPSKLGVLDMHVGIRGREARLLRLMMDTLASSGQTIGVGVGQNTAFFVSGAQSASPSATVVGQDGVYIIDVSRAKATQTAKGWSVENVSMSFLSSGDVYDFVHRNVTVESSKTLIAPGSEKLPSPGTSNDVWSSPYNPTSEPHEFTKLCRRLFDSPQSSAQGVSYEKKPEFTVVVSKTPSSQGYRFDSAEAVASFLNVNVAIFPSP